MSQNQRPPSRAAELGLLAGALLGALVLAYATAPFGLGISSTAFHHFTAAEGLRTGEGMTLSRGEPFTMWPPLMAVLLALGRSTGLAYPTVGLLINIAAYAATLFLGPMLLLRLFGSAPIAAASFLVLLVSPELFALELPLHTDPLFIALVLLALFAFALYLERPTPLRLAWVTAAATVTCLQRYPGIALALALAFLLLLYPETLTLRTRFLRAAVLGATALLPLAAWMVRNRIVQGSWGALGVPAGRSPGENSIATLSVLARFLTPNLAAPSPRWIANLAVALLLMGLWLWRLLREPGPHEEKGQRRASIVYFAFPAAYVALLLAATSGATLDPISNRYVAPMYPFLWGAVLLGFAEGFRRGVVLPAWLRFPALAAVLALFCAHVVTAAAETCRLVVQSREKGTVGYETLWAGSPLLEWLRANPLPGKVYSNLPEFYIFATGRRATYVTAETLPVLASNEPGEGHVVWVDFPRGAPPLPDLSDRGRRFACVVRLGDVHRTRQDELHGIEGRPRTHRIWSQPFSAARHRPEPQLLFHVLSRAFEEAVFGTVA
jgi:hypothetical protein